MPEIYANKSGKKAVVSWWEKPFAGIKEIYA